MVGESVSCFLTPSTSEPYTYPPSLRDEIDNVCGGYILDVDDFRTDDKQRIADHIFEMTRRRFKVAKHLVGKRQWDYFMMVEMGVDRIHHGFWKYFDPDAPEVSSRATRTSTSSATTTSSSTREVGELLSLFRPDTAVLVVSDHGAKSDGRRDLRQRVAHAARLPAPEARAHDADAVLEGRDRLGSHARVGGRRLLRAHVPQRPRARAARAGRAGRLREAPRAAHDRDRRHRGPVRQEHRLRRAPAEELYKRAARRAAGPHRVLRQSRLALGRLGRATASIYTFDNDTGPDDANHAQHGISSPCRSPAGRRRPPPVRAASLRRRSHGAESLWPPDPGRDAGPGHPDSRGSHNASFA